MEPERSDSRTHAGYVRELVESKAVVLVRALPA